MADSADRSLECEVCYEQFDHTTRRPKLLACGHTICLACVQRIYDTPQNKAKGAFLCPIDRTKTPSRPAKLKDNFYVLSLINDSSKIESGRNPQGGQLNFWCLDCKTVTDSHCKDKHALRRLYQERLHQTQPTVDQLQSVLSTQRSLAEKLETIEGTVRGFANQQVAEAKGTAGQVHEALTRLFDSLDLVGSDWEHVMTEVEKVLQSSEQRLAADEQSLQLLAADGVCEVRVAALGGAAWRANVDLGLDDEGTAVARGLLVHMQRAGLLRPDPTDHAASRGGVAPLPYLEELSLSGAGERTAEKEAARSAA